MNLSKTKAANAALAGIVNSLNYSLIRFLKEYTHDEIEGIMAHELGHQVYKHREGNRSREC
jgi:Zn-dependent protease with chaperone function